METPNFPSQLEPYARQLGARIERYRNWDVAMGFPNEDAARRFCVAAIRLGYNAKNTPDCVVYAKPAKVTA